MKNSIKRMLNAVMAITMVASATSATAFAADGDIDNLTDANNVEFSAVNEEVAMPVISVSVPTTAEIVIDPYNTLQGGQIDSTNAKIVNNSNIPLNVTLVGIKATPTEGLNLVAKAATDGTKWACVSAAVTDGANKATTKVLSAEGQDIAVTTAMAPKGGVVSFKVTGTCATAITAEAASDWAAEDKITVTTAYKFTANTFATYEVAKAPIFWDKTQATSITLPSEDIPALSEYLPSTISNAGKELPVVWYKDGAEDASDLTAEAAAGTYVAGVADEDIYVVTGTFDMPSITIAAASGT